MISAAMDESVRIQIQSQLALPAGTHLTFLQDSLGPPIPPSHKSVCTLVLAQGPDCLSLHSLLPAGGGPPTTISRLSYTQITGSIPKDMIAGYRKGLLQWIGLTVPQLNNVRVKSVLLGTRESVLVAGTLGAHLHFWLWDPFKFNEASEEEESRLEWLGIGPAEVDDIREAWYCELHSERHVPVLLLASSLGGLYIRLGRASAESGEWSCLVEGSTAAGPLTVTRFDHETLTVIRAISGYISVSMLGVGGCLLDVGQLRLANINALPLVSWSASGERLLMVAGDAQQCTAFTCALQDGTLIEANRKRLPLAHQWALYTDGALNVDAIIGAISGDAVEFYSADHSGLHPILSLPGIDLQLTAALIEPSMELLLLTTAGQLISMAELMKQQSWTDTLQPAHVSFQFAQWFDILSSTSSAFPFADAELRAKLITRRKVCEGLCVDLLTAKGSFPPSSWSELGSMATSTNSPLAFLYLLMAANQSASRIASFCRRHGVDGRRFHLVSACVCADLGRHQQALKHLALATRSLDQLIEPELVNRIVNIIAVDGDPILLATALRLLPVGLIDLTRLIDDLVTKGHHYAALSIANADATLFQHVVHSMLSQGKAIALASLPLTSLQISMATTGENESIPAVDRAIAAVMCPLARGWHAAARKAFARWAPRVPTDHIQWARIRDIIQLLPQSESITLSDSSARVTVTPAVTAASTPKRAPSTPMRNTAPTTPRPASALKPSVVASPPKTGPTLLRTPPPPTTSGASSPSSAATPSAHGVGSSSPHGSSPPLRSVLPRHVPANQPSRLANLVESSGPDSDSGVGTASAIGLDPHLFSRPHLLDVIGSEEEEQERESSEQSDYLDGLLVDEGIRYVLTESSQASPRKPRSPSRSPTRSPSRSPSRSPRKSSPRSPTKSSLRAKSSPRSPSESSARSPGKSSSPLKNEIESAPLGRRQSPRKQPNAATAVVQSPMKATNIPQPASEQSPVKSTPLKRKESPQKATPAKDKEVPVETRTQYKRRLKADLGLPSPVAKRPALAEPITPRRSTRERHPVTEYEPEVERSPQRSRSTLVTPRRPSTTGLSVATPPIRATPPASSRRSRR